VDRGIADQLHFFPDSVRFFEHQRSGQGVYTIRNYTLYLDYGGGRVVRAGFAAPAVQENAGQFDWIAIRSPNMLERVGYQPQP
jgi:hypothetical protein